MTDPLTPRVAEQSSSAARILILGLAILASVGCASTEDHAAPDVIRLGGFDFEVLRTDSAAGNSTGADDVVGYMVVDPLGSPVGVDDLKSDLSSRGFRIYPLRDGSFDAVSGSRRITVEAFGEFCSETGSDRPAWKVKLCAVSDADSLLVVGE